ncbi:MAG TPA: hypothetical protein VH881_10760 [Burkholderiales bacterium]|jgi:hypothetical protein
MTARKRPLRIEVTDAPQQSRVARAAPPTPSRAIEPAGDVRRTRRSARRTIAERAPARGALQPAPAPEFNYVIWLNYLALRSKAGARRVAHTPCVLLHVIGAGSPGFVRHLRSQ